MKVGLGPIVHSTGRKKEWNGMRWDGEEGRNEKGGGGGECSSLVIGR